MPEPIRTQIAIVGGGISGLWLLNLVRRAGYAALLFEKNGLGGGQTLASQGMIHGGIKYALGGFTTPASETIAGMPGRWEACINGTGSLDLSDVSVLSRDYYLFSDDSLSSKVTAFFGSRSLRGRVEPLAKPDYPPCFANSAFKGSLYRLQDIVIDTPSLVAALTAQARGSLFKSAPTVNARPDGSIDSLQVNETTRVTADFYIFCAGAGNEALIESTSLASTAMQRRPLKQVYLKKPGLPDIYAHAVSLTAGAKPRVTITTHKGKDGIPVWYLGGNLAETGVDRSDAEQISQAKAELGALLPWVDLADAEWQAFWVDRAEPAQKDHGRPDSPFARASQNAILCWPTKLTLTPLLGDEVMEMIEGLEPVTMATPELQLPPAVVARPPFETLFP